MGEGIEYQFSKIVELKKQGKVKVMTLAESGKMYKESYRHTPAATVATDCVSLK